MQKKQIEISYMQLIMIAVLLGLTGRMIVPKLSGASEEQLTSKMAERLWDVRRHIELYRVVHGDDLPNCENEQQLCGYLFEQRGNYYPYMDQMPENPINRKRSVRIDGAPAGQGQAGWRYDNQTGRFQSDCGVAYSRL
jgi:hypothetical protein